MAWNRIEVCLCVNVLLISIAILHIVSHGTKIILLSLTKYKLVACKLVIFIIRSNDPIKLIIESLFDKMIYYGFSNLKEFYKTKIYSN